MSSGCCLIPSTNIIGTLATAFHTSTAGKLWTATAAGLATHNALFIRGEWHLQAPHIITARLLLPFLVLALELLAWPDNVVLALKESAGIVICYGSAILSSIVIYRIFFHRLRGFSGPPLAKISNLWHVSKICEGQNHLFLESIRHKYGDFVRTGAFIRGVVDTLLFT